MANQSNVEAAQSEQAQGRETLPRTNLLSSSPLFVLLAIVGASAENFVNPELWWQILSGRQMLAAWQPRLHDIYSYTAYGNPMRDDEWLAEVVTTLWYGAAGVWGLLAMKLLLAGATMACLAYAFAETGASARVQRLMLIFTALALAPNMQFRPQLFTFAILAFEMALLARETYRGHSPMLWVMVPVFALWANLHAGFVAGLGALGAFAIVAGAGEFRRSGTMRRGLVLCAITAACALATLANPLGLQVWGNVWSAMFNPVWRKAIIEWQPLLGMLAGDLRTAPANALFDFFIPVGFFVALAVFEVLAPSFDDLALAAIAAVFIAAAFHMARFVSLAVIVIAVPLVRHAGTFSARRGATKEEVEADSGFNPVVAVILIVALAWVGGFFTGRLRMKGGYRCPAGAVAFMKQHGLQGNILSEFSWASYVMWHLGPQSRIFIDERAETLYTDKILKDYVAFYFDWPGAERVLGEYPQQFVLVPPGSGGFAATARNPGWKLIYRDNVAALFALAGSPAAAEFPAPVKGFSPRVFFP